MRKSSFIYFFISLLLVSFGQPAWAPYLAPIAAILGYALLWEALRAVSSRNAQFWSALLWFSLVQSVQLSWMTSIEYQGAYILIVYAILSLALGAQFALMSCFVLKNENWNLPKILALGGFWTLAEWARFHFLCGFSWNPIGIALTSFPLSMQLASVGGILFLSFWVIVTNLLAYQAKIRQFSAKSVALWTSAAIIPYLFGSGILLYHQKELRKYGTVQALLVQPGLLPSQKIPLDGRLSEFVSPWDQWTAIFNCLKEYRASHVDLIALPESAVPFCLDQAVYEYAIARELIVREFGSQALKFFPDLVKPYAKAGRVSNAFFGQFLANFFGADLIIGLDDREKEDYYSAAIHFTPWNEIPSRYEKRVLVPLAEYLPFAWCAKLAENYGIQSFYTHGKEAKVFMGTLPLSVSICYEETFPNIVREGRLKGAMLFVNISNDNWYPNSKLAKQHFDHGRLRAVENGVPLLRACNSGVTSAVDAFGRISGKLEEKQGVLLAGVPNYQIKTLYTFAGDSLIVGMSLGLLGFYLLFRKVIARRK